MDDPLLPRLHRNGVSPEVHYAQHTLQTRDRISVALNSDKTLVRMYSKKKHDDSYKNIV